MLLRKLAMKKHRLREGLTLIEGVRALRTALDAGIPVEIILADEDFLGDPIAAALVARAEESGALVLPAAREVVESAASVATPQGFVAAGRFPRFELADVLSAGDPGMPGPELVLIADRISDPGNLGALIRTAAALGASGYVTTPGTVDAFSPRVVRASAATVFSAPGAEGVEPGHLLDELRRRGYSVVASSPDSDRELDGYEPPSRIALLVGEEGSGLSPNMLDSADVVLRIPMVPAAESLNVASASAIFLHAFSPLRRNG